MGRDSMHGEHMQRLAHGDTVSGASHAADNDLSMPRSRTCACTRARGRGPTTATTRLAARSRGYGTTGPTRHTRPAHVVARLRREQA